MNEWQQQHRDLILQIDHAETNIEQRILLNYDHLDRVWVQYSIGSKGATISEVRYTAAHLREFQASGWTIRAMPTREDIIAPAPTPASAPALFAQAP